MAQPKKLVITWRKSAIGFNEKQKRTIRALGFTRLGQTVERPDGPAVRGMLNSVRHLIAVEEK